MKCAAVFTEESNIGKGEICPNQWIAVTKPDPNVAMSNGRTDHAYLHQMDEPAVDLIINSWTYS